MANWNDPSTDRRVRQRPRHVAGPDGRSRRRHTIDAGLRRHMLSIYNYMASGVLLTGIVAMLAFNSGYAARLSPAVR